MIDQGEDIPDRFCPMKDRGHCLHCDPCHIMCGVGGAGAYSDGLLNLHPTIGGDLKHLAGDKAGAKTGVRGQVVAAKKVKATYSTESCRAVQRIARIIN